MPDLVLWYGEEAKKQIEAELKKRIAAACKIVSDHAHVLLSKAGPKTTEEVRKALGALTVGPHANKAARAAFIKQFNRNRATVKSKGNVYGVRITKAGKVVRGKKAYKTHA